MRSAELKVINETFVTSYQDLAMAAPKKGTLYQCRIQAPAAETLHEEWIIESGGIWGYVSNYTPAHLCRKPLPPPPLSTFKRRNVSLKPCLSLLHHLI